MGTRGMNARELAENTRWWNGPEFLRHPEAEWPDCKFDKPSEEAMKELKSTPRSNNDDSATFNTTLPTDESPSDTDEAEGEAWRLDPSRYSKWYRTKPKGRLELGLSLVRVRSWVQRFINNCQRLQQQRELGELSAAELQSTEEKIIKETQGTEFREEIEALKHSQPLPRKSSILPFTPMMINGILRSNTRLRHSSDLSPTSSSLLFCRRRTM